jgi:hypothetical protein
MLRHGIPTLATLLGSFVLLGTTNSAAETFAGWRYMAPPGYTVESSNDHVALTKVTDATFCSISIFEPRALVSPARVEQALEWHNVIDATFTPKVVRRGSLQTSSGPATMTTATLVTADGTRYAGIHYVLTPPGMIGSVLLTSTSHASLAACARTAAVVVRSLEVDWTAPRFTDPEARIETVHGRWASIGTTSREYTFAANGSYRFHSESRTEPQRVVDEAGTYAMVGNQLTLDPTASNVATITHGVGRVTKGSLARTTYSWRKTYDPATNTWRVVLQPAKATARDGALPAAGYSYSDHDKPLWTFVSQPGV